MKKNNKWKLESRFVHSGSGQKFSNVRTSSTPIFQTSNFLYEDVETGTEVLVGKNEGYIYSRYSNPTVNVLNEVMAELEGNEAALSFNSGLAAISAAVLGYCKPGDHIVASALIYGGTYHLLQEHFGSMGIETSFVDPTNLQQIESSIRKNTKILYTEPLANPTLVSADISKWADLAHQNSCKLLIDNTFSPPPIFQPFEYGADLVIHSATKYLGGHSDLIGGIVIGSRQEINRIVPYLKYYGGIMTPFTAWLLLRGIRTLGVRLVKQCANAMRIAKFLKEQPNVKKVNYAGLPDNPQYEMNCKYFNGFSGMLSFEIKGGFEAAKRFMQKLELIQFTVSLGDVASLISHPASTSHIYLTPQERESIGVSDGLLRISTGIEAADDLIADLENALTG
jgi:methionine-gamma-lyase